MSLLVAVTAALLPLAPLGARSEPSSDRFDPDPVAAEPATVELVSRTSTNVRGNANSLGGAISADGRYVSFASLANNLIAGDTNGVWDVYLRNREAGTTERVSVASDETEGNGASFGGAFSADLRYVAFTSDADNLVDDDTNLVGDVFVRDRTTGTTTRVSVDSEAGQSDGPSYGVTLSADGRFVAYFSQATNLVEDDTNGLYDVFVHDRTTGQTTRVSVATDGSEATGESMYARISADGRHVVFGSGAPDLIVDDTNDNNDIFVHDRLTGETTRVSVASDGEQANGETWEADLSGDGRYITFSTFASNLVTGDTNNRTDVFVHDRDTSITTRVSVGPGLAQANNSSSPIYPARISADGRFVAFESDATNLVADDENEHTDVFLHDRLTAVTERMSVRLNGSEIFTSSIAPIVSSDGRFVTFDSAGSFAPAAGGFIQVWLRDRGTVDAPGQLRVTTSPALPATIVVDGVPRDSWGLDWVEIDAGPHEVCFGPVPGFTAPPCEDVVVSGNQATVVDGIYAQRGTLQVTTSPAVPSTITIDGHPGNDWGVWTDLDPGTYEVCFGPVEDYDPPACEDAVVTAGATTAITGTFTPDAAAPGPEPGYGYLRAVTDPAVASRITIDGHVADSWGLTWLKLDPGTYQLCFEDVLFATAPSCQNVAVSPFATTVATGTFTVHGFLQVQVSPALPVTLTVDDHPTDAWGIFTSRPPGTYEVCYRPLVGYAAPLCEDAVVTTGATTTLTGTYTPL